MNTNTFRKFQKFLTTRTTDQLRSLWDRVMQKLGDSCWDWLSLWAEKPVLAEVLQLTLAERRSREEWDCYRVD